MQTESTSSRPHRIGPYRLDGLLGVGGMGEVYRAHDERLDRWVALKQIAATGGREYHRMRQRFRREARAAARLNHPTIVQIYDVIEGDGVDWIVMELVEGETLAQRVREGPFELKALLETARDLVSGLAAAHAEGIIHRDLKAENIMLTRDGRVKILDFGLAKQLWHADSEISLSIEGTLLGTARAMAPEQALGKKADHRSDLFALGILFYELATGKSPFLGPTAVETAIRVCSHRQTPARQHNAAIPLAFSNLIDRLLEKEPARRLASVHLVAVELDDLLAQLASLDGKGQESQDRSRQGWRGSVIEPSLDSETGWGASASLPPSLSSSMASQQSNPSQWASQQQPTEARSAEVRPGETARPGESGRPALGHSAASQVRPAQVPSSEDAASRVQRERRQVTVMVCDLVSANSADLGLDPELLFEVTQEFQDRARWILQRFGGHLEPAPDHRLLVYFGYPRALEDAAVRAVLAAHALIADVDSKLSSLVSTETQQQLAVSVGIHTGPAVVQRQEERSRIILGQTLDLASVLKNRAAAGAVLVSQSTARLVEGECELDAMPALRSRRLDRPLEAFRCRPPESRQDGRWLHGDVPVLLGRDQELALLQSRWLLAREGAGQVMALVAEAGYGKTRLVRALLETSQDDSAVTLLARGSLQRREEGFGVMVTLLHQLFDFQPEDDGEQQLDKIEALLDTLDAPLETMVPLLGELLSLSTRQRYPSTNPAMEPPDKTLDTLLGLLLESSRRRPLRIVVEDLQWADRSTVELLSHLMERSASFPIFTLLTYRPEFSPSWGDGHALSRLTLDTLRRSTASDLITALFPHGIRPGARQRLLERAGGVPRYVVELARYQTETSSSQVPPSLQDPLMARFDDLGSAKELARMAAVLGRSLSEDLLQEVQRQDRLAFREQLQTLLDHGVLMQRGFPGNVELSFQHSLVQETAYGSLLGRERQRLHRRVAHILDQRVAAGQAVAPRLLAHHRRRAGDLELAIDHYEAAARLAETQGDPQGAIEALEKGLELLRHLPETAARDRRELYLLITLGPLLSGAKGFEDPQLEELYTRAGALCLQQDNEAQLFRMLRSISAFFIARARPRRSLELVQKLLEIAQEAEDTELLLEACYAVGLTHFTLGELAPARMHLEKGIALTAGRQARPPAGDSSEDPGIACHALGALVAWHLGSVDEAVRLSDEALAAARQLNHAGTLAAALSFGAWLHQLRRDRPLVERLAEETVAISQEGGFLLWSTYGQLLLGWARLDDGTVAHQVELPDGSVEEDNLGLSLDVYRDAGVLFAQTYLLSLLAEAFTQRGDIDRALRHLLEALTAVEGSGERFWQAELLRLCGTMVLESTGDDSQERRREAEGYFDRALDVARQQGCRSLELRAAASLARLWAERGMARQAAQMVETLYLSFDQGLDSADLQETRQWLDQLASGDTESTNSAAPRP